jgi:ketosteroid isomerase-like protein
MMGVTTIWSRPGRIAAILFVGLLVGCASVPSQPQTLASSDEEAVRSLEAKRGEALIKADVTALAAMVADDFVEVSRFGQIRSKADNMRDITSGALRLLTVKYEDMTVRIYGRVAVLTAVADNTGTFRGTPFAQKVRYTRIFVRKGDGWQAVAMQQTVMQ